MTVTIALTRLASSGDQFDVIIHSVDCALYQATVQLAGGERLLLDSNNRPLRRHSLQAMREALAVLQLRSLRLRHQSAYDEMIGQPRREAPNTLEIPLSTLIDPADNAPPR